MKLVYINCPKCKERVATIDGDKVECFDLTVRCVCGESFGAEKMGKDSEVSYIY